MFRYQNDKNQNEETYINRVENDESENDDQNFFQTLRSPPRHPTEATSYLVGILTTICGKYNHK